MVSSIESQQTKDKVIVEMSAQFIHDISTPLATIQILATTLETYLPDILSAHERSRKQGTDTTIDISGDQHELLENSIIKIKALAQQVNQAAKDYWHQIDKELGAAENEIGSKQTLSIKDSISLERSLNILVAEDDAIHQKIAYKNLSGQHQIDIAANGKEAVEFCQRKSYDLILMDLHMPIMDGQQAAIEIIELGNSSPIIIGLTNQPLGAEKKQMLQQGFSGFIEKPLNLDELNNLIKTLGLSND